jgi:hypothetical protein
MCPSCTVGLISPGSPPRDGWYQWEVN